MAAVQSGSRRGVWVAAVSRYVLGPGEDPGCSPGLRVEWVRAGAAHG